MRKYARIIGAAASVLALSLCMVGCGSGGNASDNQQQHQQQQIESTNPLLSFDVAYNDSLSGSGAVIGTYVIVDGDKAAFEAATEDEFGEFVEAVVAKAAEDGSDYVTVDFGNGTGLQFTGASSTMVTYGKIDDDGMLSKRIATYLCSDGKWSEM